ncbi:exported protein (hyp17) [Plasmodium reichenowi]|uniref:Exported protein (Hyp17) n=1 Tax=Plasmodium reichenowi TaxID=5854 RepID=A0A151L665_PLARE|nr:exported protein (hyp17) [Plasmodium reichenowi]KYN94429.1 exported protein (hyp17) [Plasmodium reichenowi]
MSKLKCDKLHRINNNNENIRKINSSMSIIYSTIRKNIYYMKEGTKLYYSLVKILLITFFICIFTRSNHGEFYEKWKNKPNIKSICGRRLNRSLYEFQISNNSKYFNNVNGNNQNIQIDNYNNVIDYLDDYSQNDVLNNPESMNINNEIINTKCNVLLRKQRVLYEEKANVVLRSEGASETLGDIRNKLKTRTETTNGNIYESGLYGPMKGKIDNLSNKPTDLKRTNNTDYGTKLRTPMNVSDNIKSNIGEPDPKTKVINLKNSGVSKSRVVEYEVVPKIVTTKDEGNRKINRVEYEIRAKYDTTKKNEENTNDTTTNDTSSNMETKNEPTMKNPNVTNDMTKPKMDTTKQSTLNSKSNNMNSVKSNVTTSKETPLEKPSSTIENKGGNNPFMDNDLSDKKGNMQDNNKGLKATTNKTNVKNKLGDNTKQTNQGTNPFVEDDVSDKKDKIQDNNKGLKATTNKTNVKNKLGDNTKQTNQGTNPFMDEEELEELLRREREEKNKNEKKKNVGDNQNKKSNAGVQNKTNKQNKLDTQNGKNEKNIPNKLDTQNGKNEKNIPNKLDTQNGKNEKNIPNKLDTQNVKNEKDSPNKLDSQNVTSKQNIPNKLDTQNVKNEKDTPNKLDNENKENTQSNKNVNAKKSDIGTNGKSNIETSQDKQLTTKNNDENKNSVKSSKFKDALLEVTKDIENGISSDMLNKNQKGNQLKSESLKKNELENKNTKNMDGSKNVFEKGYDLKTESKRDFNISQESGLDYTDEYNGEFNKEYDSYSDIGSTTMEYDEYYNESYNSDDYDDNYVGNPMKLFTSDIMNNYGNIKSGLKHNTNKIAKTVLKGIDDEESSNKGKNENKNKKKKDKIVIDKDDTSDNVSLNSTDPELYYNNDDYYGNGNDYANGSYYDSDMYSNSDDSESGDDNPITVLASEIVDACGNIKGGALKVKDLITEGGPQLLDLTANVVGTKTKDGFNKVKEIVTKKCGMDVESDIDIETETNPMKWYNVLINKYRKLHFGWKLFVNIAPAGVLGIIGILTAASVFSTGSTALCAIPFVAMAAILFFQVYRLTKKIYYNKKKKSVKQIF